MICVDIVMFFSGFIHQDDSFKSKIAMFNNSGANIAKEPPADPFQTEDPFKSFNGQDDFHIFCYCRPLGLRLLSAPLDSVFVGNLNLDQVYHNSKLFFFGGWAGDDRSTSTL